MRASRGAMRGAEPTMTYVAKEGGADLAGVEYWDRKWAAGQLPQPFDPAVPGVRNHSVRRLDARFREAFGPLGRGARLLEIGAARSRWLPHFAKSYDMEVYGLDYSPAGCAQARAMLEASGVSGEIVCADLFATPASMVGRFDGVISFGVVEHFDDTADALRAMAAYLRPGGIMLTLVPHMKGLVGATQRWDRTVYDLHKPLGLADMERAHRDAGVFERTMCEHFLFANFWVANLTRLPPSMTTRLKRAALKAIYGANLATWAFEDHVVRLPPNRWSSPYIICEARKAASAPGA